ncbi:MAG: GreA/GreB family elongation factor [Acidimicrobiales bacterium]
MISPASPLDQALIGVRPADVVDFEAPTGAVLKVEVVEVE